ncbi:Drug/metabolite transporter [Macleaya cordata]|uniref:Probable purine permease n=1 Tax=Macleaya cordata TaxID=56857 RepID=A0A200Q9H9_MACCD|nr:Drug/metabolite transporter [Macleaya cordata]
MAMNIEKIEEGVQTLENPPNKLLSASHPEDLNKSLMAKWGLLLLSCTCSVVGTTGGPLVLRLYFLHGGHSKWLSSWLQTVGFPILLIPLTILYFRRDRMLPDEFFASQKLLHYAAIIGLLQGLDNYMYCYGLSFLPVSTSSLLISTQLISTAFVASILVKQKFTPYSINAVVLMTMGSILLGLRKSGDRPHGVTNSQYLLGFIISIGAAALGGFILVSTQVAYAKAKKAMTYSIVLQFQFCMAFFATLFCTVGMLINKDFSAIKREANGYELGVKKYYLVLGSSVVIWQVMFLGRLGIIFCTSSLFAGIMSATILPITEIAAVITFHEKFTGEKGMALALGLWGFTSYFYGSYRKTKKQTQQTPHETNTSK